MRGRTCLVWEGSLLLNGGFPSLARCAPEDCVPRSGSSRVFSSLHSSGFTGLSPLVFSLSFSLHGRSFGSQRAVPTGCTGTCWRSWAPRKLLRIWLQQLWPRGRGPLCWAQVSHGGRGHGRRVSEQRRSGWNEALPDQELPHRFRNSVCSWRS